MRAIAVAFLLAPGAYMPLLSVGAQSDATADCAASRPQPEVDACVQIKFETVDQLLNKTYDIVIKELQAGPATADQVQLLVNSEIRKTLVESQRQWIKFRDAQCDVESTLVGTGTSAAAVGGQCLIDLTRERIRFLRRVAEGLHWNSRLCRANKARCALPAEAP